MLVQRPGAAPLVRRYKAARLYTATRQMPLMAYEAIQQVLAGLQQERTGTTSKSSDT
jgi:hypothetical protein